MRTGVRDPDELTEASTMLFEGALVLRQVHERDDAVQAAKPHVQRLIDAFVSEP